jgi:hypothetical protein
MLKSAQSEFELPPMPDFHNPRHPPAGHVNNWLEIVFHKAYAARWCTRPFCTTCGCQEFRRAYLSAAAMQAGLPVRFQAPRHPREVLAECSAPDRQLLVETLIEGLRGVSAEWSSSDAMQAVMVDLRSIRRDRMAAADLESRQGDTPAGGGLMRIRQQAQRRLEHEQFNSARAVEERERLRREQAAQRHEARQALSRQRGQQRLQLLAALAQLPVPERLSRLARDPSIRLGLVTDAVLAVQPADLAGLDHAEAATLVTQIGRRRGRWRALQRMLERRLAAGR